MECLLSLEPLGASQDGPPFLPSSLRVKIKGRPFGPCLLCLRPWRSPHHSCARPSTSTINLGEPPSAKCQASVAKEGRPLLSPRLPARLLLQRPTIAGPALPPLVHHLFSFSTHYVHFTSKLPDRPSIEAAGNFLLGQDSGPTECRPSRAAHRPRPWVRRGHEAQLLRECSA